MGEREGVARGAALAIRCHDRDGPEGRESVGQRADTGGGDPVVVAYQDQGSLVRHALLTGC
jgi:hypothetical protein